MVSSSVKSLLALVFSLFLVVFSVPSFAQDATRVEVTEGGKAEPEKEGKIKPGDILMEHILDAHEFHFITIGKTQVSIPLPVILYSPQKGFSIFMSSRFEHGATAYKGYRMIDDSYMDKLQAAGVDVKKEALTVGHGKIIGVTPDDQWDRSVKVYDFSMTRNVVQMLIGMGLLLWIMISVAGKYKKHGPMKAPSGFQNAIEPVITFVRDEVGKACLGHKYEKYMPYLLSVFFFILIGNLVGLVPGTANVTGNIAFTAVLGVISFIVILASSNGHYWGHIFNPPGVPLGVKFILVPVEVLGIFTKPFALNLKKVIRNWCAMPLKWPPKPTRRCAAKAVSLISFTRSPLP